MLDELPLGLPDGRQVVVGGERLPHLRRADVERRHAIGLEPGAHGERAPAEDVGALHALDRRQARLHDADQVVGDLVVLEDRRAEAQVHRRELRVGRLDVDGGDLGLGRQIGAHLVHARADVGERVRGVEVELQADVDGREPLDALRLDVVDAVGGGDRALERRRDEAAHQIGAGADVGGAHRDGRALELGVLAHVERADRLQAGDDDHQVDDDREDRPADEDVGEFHGAVSGSPGAGRAGAWP